MNKIVITGTKGKTTTARILYDFLISIDKNCLLVDSTGCSFNGKRFSTKLDSLINSNFQSPNVRPGRFIRYFEKFHKNQLESAYVILESSYSNYKIGLGIGEHDTGILLNIYKDHIDVKKRKDEMDILRWKSFVWSNLKKDGLFISNLDNAFTKESFKELSNQFVIGITKNPIKDKNINKKIQKVIAYNSQENTLYELFENKELLDFSKVRFTKFGTNMPLVENIANIVAFLLHNHFDISIFEDFLQKYELPREYQTLTQYKKLNNELWISKAHQIDALKNDLETLKRNGSKGLTLVTKVPNKAAEAYIQEFVSIFTDSLISQVFIYKKYKQEESEERNIKIFLYECQKLHVVVSVFESEEEALLSAIKNFQSVFHLYYDINKPLKIITEYGYQSE